MQGHQRGVVYQLIFEMIQMVFYNKSTKETIIQLELSHVVVYDH